MDDAIKLCGGRLVSTKLFKTRARFLVEGDIVRIEDYIQQRMGHYGYTETCFRKGIYLYIA